MRLYRRKPACCWECGWNRWGAGWLAVVVGTGTGQWVVVLTCPPQWEARRTNTIMSDGDRGGHLILQSVSFLPSSEPGLEAQRNRVRTCWADLSSGWELRRSVCKLLFGPFFVAIVTFALSPFLWSLLPLINRNVWASFPPLTCWNLMKCHST